MVVEIFGRGTSPMLEIAPQHFDFGHCKLNNHKALFFTLTNLSSELGLDVGFSKVTAIFVQPVTLSLQPHETKQLQMVYQPKALGLFKKTVFV